MTVSVYRARSRACPACGHPMEPHPIADPATAGEHVEIDRCASCGGTFFEFFDGEPIRLAAETLEALPPPGGAPRVEAPRCPDCGTAMGRRAYLDRGPPLARCDSCMALFVGAAELEALASIRVRPEAPEPEGWLDTLLAWVRRVS